MIVDKIGMKRKGYSNHSLRVFGITNLTREKFRNKQIMSISGHKNQDSLAIYQKVNADEKLRMGLTLGFSLMNISVKKKILKPAQIDNNIQVIEHQPLAKKTKPRMSQKTQYQVKTTFSHYLLLQTILAILK